MVPDIDNLQENKPKSSDSHSLPVHETFLSFSNMAVRANPSGDALEIGVLFIASAELPLSTESPYCADSSAATSMPPAATAAEDSGIETPLSVSSSLPQYSTNSSSTPTGYEAIESTSIITPLGCLSKSVADVGTQIDLPIQQEPTPQSFGGLELFSSVPLPCCVAADLFVFLPQSQYFPDLEFHSSVPPPCCVVADFFAYPPPPMPIFYTTTESSGFHRRR
ncbi:hypothetical protein QTP88_023688 [Uroleucon formosanum]